MSEKNKEILLNFGLHLRKLRLDRSMTQVEVSSNMNRDQQSLQRLESGKVNPSFLYLVDLSEALGISLNELFDF